MRNGREKITPGTVACLSLSLLNPHRSKGESDLYSRSLNPCFCAVSIKFFTDASTASLVSVSFAERNTSEIVCSRRPSQAACRDTRPIQPDFFRSVLRMRFLHQFANGLESHGLGNHQRNNPAAPTGTSAAAEAAGHVCAGQKRNSISSSAATGLVRRSSLSQTDRSILPMYPTTLPPHTIRPQELAENPGCSGGDHLHIATGVEPGPGAIRRCRGIPQFLTADQAQFCGVR